MKKVLKSSIALALAFNMFALSALAESTNDQEVTGNFRAPVETYVNGKPLKIK